MCMCIIPTAACQRISAQVAGMGLLFLSLYQRVLLCLLHVGVASAGGSEEARPPALVHESEKDHRAGCQEGLIHLVIRKLFSVARQCLSS